MSKKITLLGSTGSIGTQSLDVIRAQGYEVFGLSAHSHVDKILQQIEEFHPKYVCMTDPDAAARLDAALSGRAGAPKLLTGPEGLRELTDLAAQKTGGMTAVFSRNEGGFGYCLALTGGDLRAFNKEMNAALNGRGGGKPFFQQGRLGAEETAIRAYFLGKGFQEV